MLKVYITCVSILDQNLNHWDFVYLCMKLKERRVLNEFNTVLVMSQECVWHLASYMYMYSMQQRRKCVFIVSGWILIFHFFLYFCQ